jgi:transcriptional regulator with XRE-family HTH domain
MVDLAPENVMETNAGQRLRHRREELGLTLRDVEAASKDIALRHGNDSEFCLLISQLSHIEARQLVPSIFKVYTLAVTYRLDFREILRWYGIDLDGLTKDFSTSQPPRTHRTALPSEMVRIPTQIDPSFDLQKTQSVTRVIERWGVVPLSQLANLDKPNHSYAFLGLEDASMFPILLPGSFLHIDQSRNRIESGPWRTEYERPIYFVELRDGYACSWCDLNDGHIYLHAHPQSGIPPRVHKFPTDAEVVGQVVGVAMRLDGWTDSELSRGSRRHSLHN